MAFDAGMVSAVVNELNSRIIDARVEKVLQPERDEFILLLHKDRENLRLLLSAGSNSPRFHLTNIIKENPMTPPMLCMLLRKHLTGARICSIIQLGFERAVEFGFECFDEMGFKVKKYIIMETMGKYSNIIFLDSEKKVVSALKIIDLATSHMRQILPGFPYVAPPEQKKLSPLDVSKEKFVELVKNSENVPADKFILSKFYGMSAQIAREAVFSAVGSVDVRLSDCKTEKLWKGFNSVFSKITDCDFEPWMVIDKKEKPIEYSFVKPLEYERIAEIKKYNSFSELLDDYYYRRDKAERIKQRTGDIFRVLTNTENRLIKKIALQKNDLIACADRDKFRLYGDLLTANIYRLSRGMEVAELENYYEADCPTLKIKLDTRLTPSQNAQRYYKKYNKSKNAEIELTKQIKIAEAELEYIYTVFDSLTHAENESDIAEIREELAQSGLAPKLKSLVKKKTPAPKVMHFLSSGGYKIVCGKNNHQNDYITTKLAEKLDYWFHVKDLPGSHCVLMCNGEEPDAEDFTEAAMIAAYYSKATDGENVAVDYTLIKNVRKPSGAKPGFVTYQSNYTAYVTPDEKKISALKVK